ncbi:MAG TPA: sugar phosphate isomerase/epimerase family protein [Gemmatimonadaceae bacterium]|jgi:sugar phosphate isomerase/epimerase
MTPASRRLAISNIAWDAAEDDAAAAVVRRCGATGVEIAPTKWRDDPLDASPADVAAYRRGWEERGLSIVSLQSLLFGRPDLQLFGDFAPRSAFIDYLRRTIDLAAALGARSLVFGSPKNRVRGALALADAIAIATDAFREIGQHAHECGTALCIEANPPAYGCDFITTTIEAADLCRAIDHPGVRVNGDLGGITMAGESAVSAVEYAAPYLAHFHASEPNLAELGTGTPPADHTAAERALKAAGYDGWVSVEMRAAGAGMNIEAVERALPRARELYK